MTESAGASNNTTAMFDAWMKSVNDFWSNTESLFPASGDTEDAGKTNSDFSGFFKPGLDMWQTVTSAMGQTQTPPFSFSDTGSFPDTFLKMVQPVFSNITRMLQQWQEHFQTSGEPAKAFDFDTIDKQMLSVWEKMYDTEFRKFFKAPQLGLAREHQEKMTRFLDRFNILQSTLAEFLYFLAIPFKKAHTGFQEKLSELAKKNKLPADVNEYYRIWLKIVEGHYMTLFQSPDYIRTLGKTLAASAAYTRAKKDLVNDLLQQLSIPSSENMDAVYKELHALKTRLTRLEKAAANT